MVGMKNKWIWGLVGLLALSFIVIGLSSRQGGTSVAGAQDLVRYPVSQDDHILGNLNAKVVVVEYGDFQCPACAVYAYLLKQVFEQYKGQVAIVYRHFPLVEIHNNAIASAKAAEAAGVQNKFFEMLDVLYAQQQEWAQSAKPEEFFATYARNLELDLVKFQADSNSQAVENLIRAQRAEAQALNLSGTPSLFVNGKLITLPQTGAELQKIIDGALNASQDDGNTP